MVVIHKRSFIKEGLPWILTLVFCWMMIFPHSSHAFPFFNDFSYLEEDIKALNWTEYAKKPTDSCWSRDLALLQGVTYIDTDNSKTLTQEEISQALNIMRTVSGNELISFVTLSSIMNHCDRDEHGNPGNGVIELSDFYRTENTCLETCVKINTFLGYAIPKLIIFYETDTNSKKHYQERKLYYYRLLKRIKAKQ